MRQDIFHNNPNTPPDGIAYPSLFNELNSISGGVSEITPELAMKLGYAVAGTASRIAVGYSNLTYCKLLASAFIAGAGSAGVQITETDASFFAVASFIARNYLFSLTVFFENNDGRLRIRMIDKYGLPIEHKLQRQIEVLASRGKVQRAGASDIVMPKSITGAKETFALSCAKNKNLEGFSVAIHGSGAAKETLRYALSSTGCNICAPRHGTITLSVSDDGERLFLRDEHEKWYDDGHVSALLALVHFLNGEKDLAVAATAPSVIEQIGAEFDGRILRIGRDNGAREIFLSQNNLCDAIVSAVFLCSFLHTSGTTASELLRRLPPFTRVSREISVSGNRQQILKNLAEDHDGLHKENTGELRVCTDGGWVNISPARSKNSLRITGEGLNEEIASELCDLYIEKTKFVDKKRQK